MDRYDLVVIGAGPAGFAAAMRALDFKKKTLLVEKNLIGGAGVTNGALSSKTWWELSREASAFNTSLKRYNIQAPDIRYSEIHREVMTLDPPAPRIFSGRAVNRDGVVRGIAVGRRRARLGFDFAQGSLQFDHAIELRVALGDRKSVV